MESHFPIPPGHQSSLARERVLEDVRALVTDGELLLKATADDLSEKALAARQRLVSMIRRAKSFIDEFQQHSADSVRNAANRAEDVIRERPFVSVGVALGAGLVLGMLLTTVRRR